RNFPSFKNRPRPLLLLLYSYQQFIGVGLLPQSGVIPSQGMVNIGQHTCLESVKSRGRFGPLRSGLRNWALVSTQHGQLYRDSERPFVVTLIVLITRAEMDIRVLLGNLQLQRGLTRGVFSQRTQNVGSIEQGLAASLGHGRFVWELTEAIEGQLHTLQRARRDAYRSSQLNQRLGLLPLRFPQRQPCA